MKSIAYKKKSKINYWDELSEGGNTYQHGRREHRQYIFDVIKKCEVKSILDVGCGTGPIAELLEEEYSKYHDDVMEQGLDPMSFEEFLQQAMAEGQMAGGNPLPSDPTKPVNPFAPKPTGPTLPNRQMAADGGVMGIETPKRGRVDGPGSYGGIGSFFQKYIKDPIEVAFTDETFDSLKERSQ